MRICIAFVTTISLIVMQSAVALADAPSEIATAADHAGYAAASSNIGAVHEHLHHAVNCLEGPGGKEFDSANENPCAKEGKGAIPDTIDTATKVKLQAAVTIAETGIASSDEATARKAATELYATLRSLK